jgi:hypothetical protein
VSILLRLATCVVLVSNVALLHGQTRKASKTVDYLCGKLTHVDSREAGGHGAILEHTSRLPNVVISLYSRDKGTCCGDQKVIERVTTGKSGEFTFANAKSGAYWLVATVINRQFTLALRLARPTATSAPCQLQEFEIFDCGDFRLTRMIGYL